MLSGDIPFKLCPNNFQCGECAYDQMFSDRPVRPFPIEYEKVSKVSGFYLPEGLHFHRAHAWARIEGGGRIRVGLDDFGRRLIGKTDAVELPPLGRELKQGETGWRLRRGNRLLGALSPVDGTVVAVNRKLEKDPSIAHEDPYGEGWAFIVEPKNLTRNIRNLLYGDVTREWYSEDAHRLLERIGTELGQTIPDGGLPVEDIYEAVDEDTWEALIKEFLFA
jgi:glycine cleavage system H lipoate-binding protein